MLRLCADDHQVGQRDGEHAFACRAFPTRSAFEQIHAAQAVAGGERHQQVFLAGEMLIERADGVVAFLGDAGHLQ